MAYRISYKPYAERDMWQIADFISEDSIIAAQKFLSNLKEKIESLSDMPYKYPKIDPDKEYRKMVVDRYVVLYVVEEQSKKVLIMRVVHGMRNYQDKI